MILGPVSIHDMVHAFIKFIGSKTNKKCICFMCLKKFHYISRKSQKVSPDSQKVLNVPCMLKSTFIMFLNIKVQKSYLNGLNLKKLYINHL